MLKISEWIVVLLLELIVILFKITTGLNYLKNMKFSTRNEE